MILCPNGHENPEGTTYCHTCKTYIDSSAPHVPEPPVVPEPTPTPAAPVVSLEPVALSALAGQEATTTIRISNAGASGEFAIAVAGPAAPWAAVSPLVLSLAQGAEGVVSLRFVPPKTPEIVVGTIPFRVNVTPTASPADAVSVDGVIEVAAPAATATVQAALEPVTSEGRRDAEHVVGVWNLTQSPVRADLSSGDDTGFLAFEIEPSTLTIGAGGASSAQLTVRARKRVIFRGKRLRPFHVAVAADGTQLRIEGAMLQRRFVPWWAVPFAGAFALVVTLAVLLVLAVIVIVIVANV
jgi:hypothetical protein